METEDIEMTKNLLTNTWLSQALFAFAIEVLVLFTLFN